MLGFRLSLYLLVLFLLISCGGGGDNFSQNSSDNFSSSSSTKTIDGLVVDGYIRNAEVWLETTDYFSNLDLSLELNGKRRQTGNTSLMIFNFNFLISHISQFITLMPGDIITTGTPAGVGMGMTPPDYLKDGDEMILKVDNLGEQKLKVIKEK